MFVFIKCKKEVRMNSIDWFIINEIIEHGYKNQRDIATRLHCSLGSVNNSIKLLRSQGLLDEGGVLTDKGAKLAKTTSPQNAVILAAGYGMRMVPINMDVPKGLVEVNGEVEYQRGKKLYDGDLVSYQGEEIKIVK